MAVINLNKITPVRSKVDIVVSINGQDVVIKQYVPINVKAAAIERILSNVFNDEGIISPVRERIFVALETISIYTNISITEKALEKADQVYDNLLLSGVLTQVKANIPAQELQAFVDLYEESVKAVERYNHSFVGMMRTISEDYQATRINVDEMM